MLKTENQTNLIRLVVLSALTMLCFAGNSLLCRLALRTESIDPVSFTAIRIFSGAVILFLLVWSKYGAIKSFKEIGGGWKSGVALVVYAAGFSWAYIKLSTATGALILFGCVQGTMIFDGYRKGERFSRIQLLGCILSITGLLILLVPGLSAPAPISALLMAIAGVAWGVYSLLGRTFSNPIIATKGNFIRALPIALGVTLFSLTQIHYSAYGVLLAVTSGAITSGLGYAIWYIVLPNLKSTTASIMQLSVPILATLGGALILGEEITARVVLSSALTLVGIGLVIFIKSSKK